MLMSSLRDNLTELQNVHKLINWFIIKLDDS